jgi:hypothetical protein
LEKNFCTEIENFDDNFPSKSTFDLRTNHRRGVTTTTTTTTTTADVDFLFFLFSAVRVHPGRPYDV